MHLNRFSRLVVPAAAAFAIAALPGCTSGVHQLERQRERMISNWHKSETQPGDWNRAGLISEILKLDREIAELENRRDYAFADRFFDTPRWFGKMTRDVSDFSTGHMVSFYPVKVRVMRDANAAAGNRR